MNHVSHWWIPAIILVTAFCWSGAVFAQSQVIDDELHHLRSGGPTRLSPIYRSVRQVVICQAAILLDDRALLGMFPVRVQKGKVTFV